MNELREWLILIRTPGLGPSRLRSLLKEFGSPSGIVRAPAEKLRRRRLAAAAVAYLGAPDEELIARDARWLWLAARSLAGMVRYAG